MFQNNPSSAARAIHFLLMFYACLYINIALVSLVFVYKYLSVWHYEIGVSALIAPFWYAVGDAIAELFGYRIAKQIIWINVFSCLFFAIICTFAIHVPSPASWHYQGAYDYIFGSMLRVSSAAQISILIGALLNAYFLSKWRMLLKGKYFWLRSLGSSLIGLCLQVLIASILIYLGKIPLAQLAVLVLLTIAAHLIISLVIVWPNTLVVAILKRYIPVSYQSGISWNPFAINHDQADS